MTYRRIPSRSKRVPAAALMFWFVGGFATAQPYPDDTIAIGEIQGAGHHSPYLRERVERVLGVVTGVAARGFYMQSPIPDDLVETSEGIYVNTIRAPGVQAGDLVLVSGRVEESHAGGRTFDLSQTVIGIARVQRLAEGHALPDPIVIGAAGRLPPTEVISDDSHGPVHESPFDPAGDGIDFYESLEGMLVRVEEPVSVGTTNTLYGEVWVLADRGRGATGRNARGGITISEGDFNPERILIDYLEDTQVSAQRSIPIAEVGDVFSAPIDGVVAYSYGNFKVLPTGELPPIVDVALERQISTINTAPQRLRVAAFNVQNLGGTSPQEKFADLGETIASGLRSPAIVALAEVQDNNGPQRDAVVAADRTASLLIAAIEAAGGASDYTYIEIAPRPDADGGQPGGNIRVAFLYREERVDLIGAPYRIDEESRAFATSRKPLLATFRFGAEEITLIACHLNSKSGDAPLFGATQPPVFRSESQRLLQAQAIGAEVDRLLAVDGSAKIIVLGDLNEFAFAPPVQELIGAEQSRRLYNLAAELLPEREVYSYVYEGNSEVLDHILVSEALMAASPQVQIVHRYSEYLYENRQTDHDPVIAGFELR